MTRICPGAERGPDLLRRLLEVGQMKHAAAADDQPHHHDRAGGELERTEPPTQEDECERQKRCEDE